MAVSCLFALTFCTAELSLLSCASFLENKECFFTSSDNGTCRLGSKNGLKINRFSDFFCFLAA